MALQLAPLSASFAKAGGGESKLTLEQISFDFNCLFNQLSTKSSRTLGALPYLVLHQEASQITKVLLV